MSVEPDYDYPLTLRRVVDGDTIDVTLTRDIGFHVTASATVRLRLLGVDTPERGQPGWAEATAFTLTWLTGREGIRVTTHKADSFGRWLGYVYVPASVDPSAPSLNGALLVSGNAVEYRR